MKQNKPVIFLDFDGVVETITWQQAEDGSWSFNVHKDNVERILTNTQAIGWLNELYRLIPYDVVVSSTWRNNKSVEWLQELLWRSGFLKDIKVIGKTPTLYQDRGIEIQQWIDENNFKGKFIIIDDDSDMCHLLNLLVRTDTQLGFTIYDFHKARRMLGWELTEYEKKMYFEKEE